MKYVVPDTCGFGKDVKGQILTNDSAIDDWYFEGLRPSCQKPSLLLLLATRVFTLTADQVKPERLL